MTQLTNKVIGINIQSEVQFFSMAPLIEELIKNNYNVKVLVNKLEYDHEGFREMAEHTAEIIKKAGLAFEALEDYADFQFDIFLTPYMDNNIQSKCYLKYEYGTLNIKPNLTYTPELMGGFHGFLCQSTITKNLLSVYGKTFAVDNLRFFKKHKNTTIRRSRKVVLFAPTYNDLESPEELIKIIEKLKTEYYVIVKGHHGTQYLKRNCATKTALEKAADEYYGSETNIADLILKADVCLFGNSSAIAEALYANIPCAIFSHNLDSFKLGGVHTSQYHFVEDGYLYCCSDHNRINDVLQQTLQAESIRQQNILSEQLFPKEFHTGVYGYIDVIKYFLEDKQAQEYIQLHNYRIQHEKESQERIVKITKELNASKDLLEDYSKRKLYKLANKLYKLEGKLLHGKN